METTKKCSRCGLEKTAGDFQRRTANKDGLHYLCKTCSRDDGKKWYRTYKKRHAKTPRSLRSKWLFARYGVTLEQYDDLHKSQEGVCAICKEAEVRCHRDGKPWPLGVDHDHKTGKVRGLLCSKCNHGIADFRDDIGLLLKAIDYLKQ